MNLNRRRFFKRSALALGLIPASSLFSVPGERIFQAVAWASGKLKLIDPNNKAKFAMAVALGYIHDADKVDVKKWPKKSGAAGKNQFCWNCQFYQGPDKLKAKYPGREKLIAPCQLFANPPGYGVKSLGWCNSWAEAKS